MSLQASIRLPQGNARILRVVETSDGAEVDFTPEPRGGPECLWFCLRLEETDRGRPRVRKPIKLFLRHARTLLGVRDAEALVPVLRRLGGDWARGAPGAPIEREDGQYDILWRLDHPDALLDVALCFPYARPELDALLAETEGVWRFDHIGLTQGGEPLPRIFNLLPAAGERRPGIYVLARQHAGETPGSWVLDGFLRRLADGRAAPFVLWGVPLADLDGVTRGDYGKDQPPVDINRAWGRPPLRHETLVIQQDVERWRARCLPALALDFHAPGGGETGGAYAYVPEVGAAQADVRAAASGWAAALQAALSPEYAHADFLRTPNYPSRWNTPNFTRYMLGLGIPALTLETPYALCNGLVLTRERYQEIGARIAEMLCQRLAPRA